MKAETQVATVSDAPLPVMAATQDSQSNQIIHAVLGAVSDPTIDLDRMTKLLAIRDEILAKEAEKEFAVAMAKTQASIGSIVKNKFNSHTKSAYSDLAAINAALVPAYTAQGISLSFSSRPSDIQGHLVICCKVRHTSGHTEDYEYPLPYDGSGMKGNTNKTPIHANASTVSYGQRYLTSMIFNVASFDDDAQAAAATHDRQPEPEALPPYAQDKINSNWESWKKLVEEGKKTPAQIITNLKMKATLTAEQEAQLLELGSS